MLRARRYIVNTSWMLLEQLFRLFAGLLVGIYVARHLGPADFGTLSYVIAFGAMFGTVAKLGLDAVIVKEIVENPKDEEKYLATAFRLRIFASVFALLLITASAWTIQQNPTTKAYLVIIGFGLIFQSLEIIELHFHAHVQAKYISICRSAQLLLSSAAKLWLVHIDAELMWFVVVTLFDQITLAAALYISLSKNSRITLFAPFDRSAAARMANSSWPLLGSAVATIIYVKADHIIIHALLGERAVGIYSAAIRISELWAIVPVIVSASLFPAILSAKTAPLLYQKRMQRLYAFLLWGGALYALSLTLWSDRLIVWLYGESFQPAASVLRIHVWSSVFMGLLVSSGKWLVAEHRTRAVLERAVLGAAINLGLNAALIPVYGMQGAAWSSVIAVGSAALLYDATLREHRSMLRMKLNACVLRGLR